MAAFKVRDTLLHGGYPLRASRPVPLRVRLPKRAPLTRHWKLGLALVVLAAAAGGFAYELRTSHLLSGLLTRLAARATYTLGPGPSEVVRFPGHGAYDTRLGYTLLPAFTDRLEEDGYAVDAQARVSPGLTRLTDRGLTPPYREKAQAGLLLLDRSGRPVFSARYPERIYARFEDVPPLVVRTLLFLENRELLNAALPYRNPAIEWDRLLRAGLHYGIRRVNPDFPRLGGSTLATQLEKIRHSPLGITSSPSEKVRQVASASVRAYLDGRDTLPAQRRLVTDYLNAIPLAAVAGHGEVIGLGDGLALWFGEDFDRANRLLASVGRQSPDEEREAARIYRQVVTLLVANRRPSDYLFGRSGFLDRLTEGQLNALQEDDIISARFAELARAIPPEPRPGPREPVRPFAERKAATGIRANLAAQLDVPNLYALDRLDLTVSTTLDQAVQLDVARALRRLTDPAYARDAGLVGPRLLADVDPRAVVYSVVLYERSPAGDLLRVQADNLDQPLDVNESTKLELGSTAKLRTLVTYLEAIVTLYDAYAGRPPSELVVTGRAAADPLTRWALTWLQDHPHALLPQILDAALDRPYSADPTERFLTGGGVHTFQNFDHEHDSQEMTVREGFRQSVNLVFVRLLRDLVTYHMVRQPGWSPDLFADQTVAERRPLLAEFADYEGTLFLQRFLNAYADLPADVAVDRLTGRLRSDARRVAAVHRSVYPAASLTEFADFLARATYRPVREATAATLYEQLAPARMSLVDRAYVADVHPLELWLVADLVAAPQLSRADRLARARTVHQDAYDWLFRTRNKAAQDGRIRAQLERAAFAEIHRSWQRVGYPFRRLVPSYATALGSSGDRASALAELMGIIQSGGLRYPRLRLTSLAFAEGTPFETRLSPRPPAPERVLDATVAAMVRDELVAVVEQGTGRRAFGAFERPGGTRIPVGGKTGTGDNRVEVRGEGTGRVLNRTATFTFFIGDRFHGTLMAYVDSDRAAEYHFTSALAAQVFRHLAPMLEPLIVDDPIDPPEVRESWAPVPRSPSSPSS